MHNHCVTKEEYDTLTEELGEALAEQEAAELEVESWKYECAKVLIALDKMVNHPGALALTEAENVLKEYHNDFEELKKIVAKG
jgi:hypothetical protein